MYLEVRVLQVLFELAAEIDGCVFQLRNLDSRVVFVLPCGAEILYDEIGLACKGAVYLHGSFGVGFGHLEEGAQNIDHGLVEDLKEWQQVQHKKPEDSYCDLVFGFVQDLRA